MRQFAARLFWHPVNMWQSQCLCMFEGRKGKDKGSSARLLEGDAVLGRNPRGEVRNRDVWHFRLPDKRNGAVTLVTESLFWCFHTLLLSLAHLLESDSVLRTNTRALCAPDYRRRSLQSLFVPQSRNIRALSSKVRIATKIINTTPFFKILTLIFQNPLVNLEVTSFQSSCVHFHSKWSAHYLYTNIWKYRRREICALGWSSGWGRAKNKSEPGKLLMNT